MIFEVAAMDDVLPFEPYSNLAYEKQAEDRLKESLYEYLDDDQMINRLPSVIKGTIIAARQYHQDRADQINHVYRVLFPEDRLDDV